VTVAVVMALMLGFAAVPIGAQQSSRLPRVGILSPYAAEVSSFEEDVKAGLKDLGYVDGQTIELDVIFSQGRTDQLSALASELVQRKVDVIVTTSAPAVRAAQQATAAIPIVIGGVDDAVEQGFVASLAKPGGNITGTSWLEAELSGKRLDLLRQTLPDAARIGVLREAVGGGASARAVMLAAQSLGVQVHVWELRASNELADVFADMAHMQVDGLSVLQSPMMTSEAHQIVSLVSKYRLPAIFPDRRFVEAGGLMSYGPNLPTMYRRAAGYIARILKGASPADLPVEQPTEFELVVNLRAASALGIDVPASLLARATELVE
jgi:putative ABC transport system substrate-binding protein